MTENWKPVPGLDAYYEVSDQGRVRSLPRQTARGIRGGQVVKPYLRHDGYREVYLSVHRNRTRKLLHRLVLEAFVGPCPDGKETLHGSADKTDNRLVNLKWGYRSQNMGEDRARDHQSNRGERHGQAKLTWEDACEIRRLLGTSMYQKDIAAKFGVCKQTVTNIKYGRIWQYPPESW